MMPYVLAVLFVFGMPLTASAEDPPNPVRLRIGWPDTDLPILPAIMSVESAHDSAEKTWESLGVALDRRLGADSVVPLREPKLRAVALEQVCERIEHHEVPRKYLMAR